MRRYLLLILIILGIFLLIPFTNTYAVTPGMHTVIAKPDCNKCHSEIQSQLGTSHSTIGCEGCHLRVTGTHVTKIIRCEDCHINPQDIHTSSYPNCIDCHVSHGQLKYDYHNNATFMRTHTCTSCHNMYGTFSLSISGGETNTYTEK